MSPSVSQQISLTFHPFLFPFQINTISVVLSAGAVDLPRNDDDDIAVEFDNVFFHYPTQPGSNGLRGLSFKMKRGTTTAVVGPTGAGKVSY